MSVYLFKYNPSGTPESGATQIKTLQYRSGNIGSTGWYAGVNDSGVYVITSDTTTTGLTGRTTGGGTGVAGAGLPTFWKTAGTSEAQLLAVVNRLPGSPGNLTTIAGATGFLNSNNYGLFPVVAAGVSFIGSFVNNAAPLSAVETAWNTFRAALTGSYTTFTISSTNGSSVTVTDPTKVQTLANNLRTATVGSVIIGGVTWLVGTGCGVPKIGGVAVEFSNVASCSASSTVALRPMINNLNWGGIGTGSTVGQATQTITVTFS
jgi:hypothetical protein